MPEHDKIIEFYKHKYYHLLVADQFSGERSGVYESILNDIAESGFGKRLLDVGTGCGYFLCAARKIGWTVEGVDPSIDSVEFALKVNNLKVFCGTLKEYSPPYLFDAITFINSLDHSAAPWEEVKNAIKLLAPNGVLMIRHPNGWLHGALAKFSQALCIYRPVSRYLVFHEYSFTPRFMIRLLSDFGFTNISIKNSKITKSNCDTKKSGERLWGIMKLINPIGAAFIYRLSGGRLLLGASLDVKAVGKTKL